MSDRENILSKLDVGGGRELYLLTRLHAQGEEGFDLSLTDTQHAWTNSSTYAAKGCSLFTRGVGK